MVTVDSLRIPDYSGSSLLNLVAELEWRLTGSAAAPRLHDELQDLIPAAATYVFVLFDGLGDHQLSHREAAPLRRWRSAALDAVYPTTTSTNLATLATGLSPATHGLIAHQLWLPGLDLVVNTLKWTTPWGDPVDIDHPGFLPAPNLWERLREAGIEPVTVQPGNFESSPLSRVLYRRCRYEAVWTEDEIVTATLQLAATGRRLIFTYVPHVDVAAHVYGQGSEEYANTVELAANIWEALAARLPGGVVMVGTADHGHIDYREEDKTPIANRANGPAFYGDPRTVFVRAADPAFFEEAAGLPARLVEVAELRSWLGPGPDHQELANRLPDVALLADDGRLLLPRFMDKRLIGYHGGLAAPEVTIPLLVAR